MLTQVVNALQANKLWVAIVIACEICIIYLKKLNKVYKVAHSLQIK